MNDTAKSAPLIRQAFYERMIRGFTDEGGQRMVIERLPCMENGSLVTNVFATPRYYAIGGFMISSPQGERPHQFEYEVIGATNPEEAFLWMEEQADRGAKEEKAKLDKMVMRARLLGKGQG